MQFINSLTVIDPNLLALDVTVLLPGYSRTLKTGVYSIENLIEQSAGGAYIQIEIPCGYSLQLTYANKIVRTLSSSLYNFSKKITVNGIDLQPGDYITYDTGKKLQLCGIGSTTILNITETPATYPSTMYGVVGTALPEIQFTASTLTAPIVYSLGATSPALPVGVTLSAGGLLSSSGNLTTIYNNSIIVVATDNSKSTYILTVPVLIYTTPDAPTGVSASAGSSQATVTWVAPVFNGNSAITGYRVYNGATLVGSEGNTTTSLVITSLTPGTSYTFTVKAVNAAGEGAGMASTAAVVPYTMPGAPTIGAAVSGLTTLALSWAPTTTGYSDITSYKIYTSDTLVATIAGAYTTATLSSGLTPGTLYKFTVKAVNAAGYSSASSESANASINASPVGSVVITGTPMQKETLTATNDLSDADGLGALSYQWSAAAPGAQYIAILNATASTFMLTQAQVHSFIKVTISYTDGHDTFEATTSAAVGAVANVNDLPDGTVTISGTTISGHKLTAENTLSDADGIVALNHQWKSATTSNGFYSPISGATAYEYTLTATEVGKYVRVTISYTDNEGASESAVSNYMYIYTVPGFPTGVSASVEAAAGQAVISWTAPGSTGGDPILSYTVSSNVGGFTATTADGTARTATITGLTNNSSYTFTVTAHNNAGDSAASSASSSVTPYTTPAAPTSVSVTSTNAAATVTWASATNTSGSAITEYIITSSPAFLASPASMPPGLRAYTATGLTNGTSYTFSVVAVNARGSSSALVFDAVTPHSIASTAPRAIVASVAAAAGQAVISWSAPIDNGGTAILNYTVTSNPATSSVTTADGVTTTATFTGLTNGQSYTFDVLATNSVGPSPSATSSAVVPFTTPNAPVVVSITSTNAAATLTWSAPSINGGSAVTNYTITAAPSITPIVTSSTSYTVTGLTNGVSCVFSVTANNARGQSTPVAFSSVTPMPIAPTAPLSVKAKVTANSSELIVAWSAPADNGGAAISEYTVTSTPAGFNATTNGSTLSTTITGLSDAAAYTFVVKATNSVGPSGNSSSSNSATPHALPTMPVITSASISGANMTLNWTPSVNQTAYSITVVPATQVYHLDGITSSANLVIALDGDSLGAIGANVSRWANGTGDANYDFTSVGAAPVVAAGAVAGTKVVRFTQEPSQGLRQSTSLDGITTWSVMLVARMYADTNHSRILQDSDNNLLFGWWGGYKDSFYSSTYSNLLTSGGVADTQWRIYTFTMVGTALTMSVGGVKSSYTTNGNSPTRTLGLGGAVGSYNEPSKCEVAALYVWNGRAINDVERLSYEHQLVTKYGIPTATWNSASLDTDGGDVATVTTTPDMLAASAVVTFSKSVGGGVVSMYASNPVGNSAIEHVAIVGNTVVNVPTAPTAVVALSELNARSAVSWVASSSDGGARITYVVTSSPGGVIATTTSNSVSVGGLLNNKSYTFSVVATNIAGESDPVVSNAATPTNITRAKLLSNASMVFMGKGRVSL
jgi:hypothetical protein